MYSSTIVVEQELWPAVKNGSRIMQRQIPKGTLILIGGAEDRGINEIAIQNRNKQFVHFEIIKELLPNKKKNKKHILEIITTASADPNGVMDTYSRAFKNVGFNEVGYINVETDPSSSNPEIIKRINNAHAVLFSGGNQFRLSTILGNTDIIDVIIKKYYNDPDFIVAGTSAGAMAAAAIMIYEGQNDEAILKDTVKLSSGLGFINHCIIDTHFAKRARFGRLAEAILMNPSCIGIGLGEDTALTIKKGNEAICSGSGMVVILDGRDITHTNISYAESGTPLCVENLRVHILAKGNGFLLKERKFVISRSDIKKQKELAVKENKTGSTSLKKKKTQKVVYN
ncbi:MAG TPA: cyanophycinase [Bacteroidia bacterium]|jgi:cyanophycinase|nr:cyanophycinase [Bacteroidia bacterium]